MVIALALVQRGAVGVTVFDVQVTEKAVELAERLVAVVVKLCYLRDKVVAELNAQIVNVVRIGLDALPESPQKVTADLAHAYLIPEAVLIVYGLLLPNR